MNSRPVKLPWGRFGPPVDIRGAIVKMEWRGETLLGRVAGLRYNEYLSVRVLDVRHFNGEPWPIEPQYFAVDVLPPDYVDDSEHATDTDCTIGPDGCCTVCHVLHGDPCEHCGGCAYHAPGCREDVEGTSNAVEESAS